MNKDLEFSKLFHNLMTKPLDPTIETQRLELKRLKKNMEFLYKKHLAKLHEKAAILEAKIKVKCEHPKRHSEVDYEEWNTDDGEGNEWSGTKYKFTCKACGYSKLVGNQDEGPYHSRRTRFMGKEDSELQNIWEKLEQKEHAEAQKKLSRQRQEDERKTYLRLKEKYGP